jgi:hypothetical protein
MPFVLDVVNRIASLLQKLTDQQGIPGSAGLSFAQFTRTMEVVNSRVRRLWTERSLRVGTGLIEADVNGLDLTTSSNRLIVIRLSLPEQSPKCCNRSPSFGIINIAKRWLDRRKLTILAIFVNG